MDQNVDKKGRLDEEVFTYRATKDKKVFIYWNGRQVKVLNSENALTFIDEISEAEGKEAQLIMAKATGNFKHGNEKQAKNKVDW